MRLIAHRGNTNGPTTFDNTIYHFHKALKEGFDIEIDVREINGKLHIGHDEPGEIIDINWLRNKRIWTHAKTYTTLLSLLKYPEINCFYHDNDEVTLTSKGYAWYHSKISSGAQFGPKSVLMLNECFPFDYIQMQPYAICTDYPTTYRQTFSLYGTEPSKCFKVLVLDIDGVMTSGKKIYGYDGCVFGKEFCDRDFTAIKRFKAAGINVCFLTGDNTVNYDMATLRKIDFIYAKDNPEAKFNLDKSLLLKDICKKYNVSATEIAYVGDDYYDLSIMEQVGWSFCPEDAIDDVKKRVCHVIKANGGDGVVAKLYSLVQSKLEEGFPYDNT